MKLFFEKLKIYGPKKYLSFVLNELRVKFFQQLIKKSYSMLKEDLVIDKLLDHKKKGFYVDIGANDPVRFNNTKRFYDKGWQGINIEPNKIKFLKLKKQRPKDINLNFGIASKEKRLNFFHIDVDMLSTFSRKDAVKHEKEGFKILACEKVSVKRLDYIFSHYAKGKKIDFISIDTEGYDLEVLKSNNWNKYRSQLICIEFGPQDTRNNAKKDTFLRSIHYSKIYQNGLNLIYKDSKK